MMEVWVEPSTGRIKAVYRGCTTSSKVWSDAGYKKYDKIEDWMLPMKPPAPDPPAPTTLIGEDEKEYVIGAGGVVKPKPTQSPV